MMGNISYCCELISSKVITLTKNDKFRALLCLELKKKRSVEMVSKRSGYFRKSWRFYDLRVGIEGKFCIVIYCEFAIFLNVLRYVLQYVFISKFEFYKVYRL